VREPASRQLIKSLFLINKYLQWADPAVRTSHAGR
jgi:hypothetical protein